MIKSRKDYTYYNKSDKIISGRDKKSFKRILIELLFPDLIGKFLSLLRKLEYIQNTKQPFIISIYKIFLKKRFKTLSLKLGFSIPINAFGPGLVIPHYGTIIVHGDSKVGAFCVLHTSTCLAGEGIILGDNTYISTGVIITSSTHLKNSVSIAANSLVNKSFESESILIAGSPAKVKKNRNSWFEVDGEKFKQRIERISELKKQIYS